MTSSKISQKGISATAMVLAAGLGLRLRPLTKHTPKPLVDLGGMTLLDYHLHALKDAGFEHVIVNTHHLAEQIHTHLKHHSPLPYTISHEDILLGSGGGLANVVEQFQGQPFLVINSDAFTTGDIASVAHSLMETFNPNTMDALLLYANRSHTRGFSEELDFFMREGLTIPCTSLAKERIEYLGLQILKPALFEGKSGVFSVFDVWHPLVMQGRLHGYIDESGVWFETGHVDGIEMARTAFQEHKHLRKTA